VLRCPEARLWRRLVRLSSLTGSLFTNSIAAPRFPVVIPIRELSYRLVPHCATLNAFHVLVDLIHQNFGVVVRSGGEYTGPMKHSSFLFKALIFIICTFLVSVPSSFVFLSSCTDHL
jgi:hypothetical protein